MSVIELIPVFTPGGLDVGFELANASKAGCGCTTGADEKHQTWATVVALVRTSQKHQMQVVTQVQLKQMHQMQGFAPLLRVQSPESFYPNASNITGALSVVGRLKQTNR